MGISVTQIGADFINKIAEYFTESKGILSITEIEHDLTEMVQNCVCDLLSQYLEEVDERLLADKAGRRQAGYSVERHGDERQLLTRFGELRYARTYYARKNGTYAYLTNQVVGLESYSRVSEGVSVSLAKAAGEFSYAKSSHYVTGGEVSRQTVMNKVRRCQPVSSPAPQKRNVPALHIDADEDHVTMVGGKKSIVPLISVYEGIEKCGKRGICRSIFHISEYGKSTEELWEQALTAVETRYDLDGTQVYLHGDGASWIQQGLEWFAGAKFVLDKYPQEQRNLQDDRRTGQYNTQTV